ncbi:MAG TPA: zf-HC2 domain-containing protein [Longimicrobiales bacterium]
MDGSYDRWTDRLSEYLDEELPRAERAALEAHLGECADCTRTLRELQAVVAEARAVEDVEPAADLWAGIAARLQPAMTQPAVSQPAVIAFPPRRRHFAFTLPQLAAAGIAVVVVSSTIVWLITSRVSAPATSPATVAVATPVTSSGSRPASAGERGESRAATSPTIPPATSSAPASAGAQLASARPPRPSAAGARLVRNEARGLSADRAYDSAVSDMERLLRRERSRLQPETVKVLEASLADIDRAIAEARRALARDPANVYLNDHLAESMRLKLELLRTATALTQS